MHPTKMTSLQSLLNGVVLHQPPFVVLLQQALDCGRTCALLTDYLGIFRRVDKGKGAAALVVLPTVWVLSCEHWFDVANGEDVVRLQKENWHNKALSSDESCT